MRFALSIQPVKQEWLPLVLLGGLVLGVIYALLPWSLAVAFTIGTAVVLLAFRNPFFAFLILVFVLPFERIGAYESSFGTIRISQILTIVVLVIWTFRKFLVQRFDIRPNPLVVPLLFFLGMNIVGLTQSPNPSYSLTVLALTLLTVILSWLVPQVVRTQDQLKKTLIFLLVSATLVSLFGLFQFFGDVAGLPTTVTGLRTLYTKDVLGFPRIQSTALEPLYFANFLLLPLSLAYAFFLRREESLPRWLPLTLFVLFAANLILTISRGGYLAFATLILVVSALSLRQLFKVKVIVPLAIGAILMVFFVSWALSSGDVFRLNLATFFQHVQNVFFGPSFLERVETFEQAKLAFTSSPWIGIGPGGFGPFAANHPLLRPDSGWRIVNNEPLELLAETGVLGFLALLTMMVLMLTRSIKALSRSTKPFLQATHVGLLGAFLAIIVQYQTFSVLYIMHIWFLIGFLVAVQNLILLDDGSDE